MSQNQNNSKNRKSKFSNNSSSNPPTSSVPDSSSNIYAPSFKPQAPPSQAPHYYNTKPGYPQNPNVPTYPDYSKPSNTSSDALNLPNYGMSYMAFYPQAQPPSQNNQNIAPPPRGSNPMEVQQPQYGNFYNMPQGYLFAPGYQSGYMDQGFSQQDLNSGMMGGMPGMGQGVGGYTGMQEERQKMEVLEGYGDSGAYPKRQRKEQDERPSEFDVVQKKTKTENLYQQRLEILANELAKIKETEISIIQAFLNSPHPNISNLKARKDLEALLMQKGVIQQTPLIPSNLVVQAAVVSLPHEALRTMFAALVNAKVKDAAEIEQMKKDHIIQVRKEEEQLKNGNKMEQEGEEPLCKVIHVSTQQFYQAEPAMKELEDKLERMEHVLREKRAKVREATKKVGDTQLGLAISQTKYEIATKRLEEMGLLNKQEGK